MSDSSGDEVMVVKPEASSSKSNRNDKKVIIDEEEEEEEEEGEEGTSPKGKKRSRKERDLIDDGDEQVPMNGDSLLRDTDGYCMGSIIRIRMKHFLTYDDATCYPGPDLNMIIGPNGTGKSTIAAAIVLGLGGSPKTVAKDHISDCVKYTYDNGFIEIELKGPIGKSKNVIIKREINSENDTTTFKMNGEKATLKEVNKKMDELNVQLGNLCTFLPQDRVTNFAQMSPSQLLEETQKAAGDHRLSGWHRTLIEERNAQQLREIEVTKATEQLKRREAKQAENEKTVKQFEQRRKVEAEIAVLQLLVPCAKYNVAREQWNEAKGIRNVAEGEMKELEAANAPFRNSEEALSGIKHEYEKIKETNAKEITKIGRDVQTKTGLIKKCLTAIEADTDKLDALKSSAKNRANVIKKLESDIAKNAEYLKHRPAQADMGEIQRSTREKNAEKSALIDKLTAIGEEFNELTTDLKSIQNKLDLGANKLQSFNNVQNIKENALARWDPPTWTCLKWMRENARNFKGKYYEPVRLVISATNKNNLRITEAPLSKQSMRAFVFEEQEDYDYMMMNCADKGINGKQQRINSAVLAPGTTLASFPRLLSDEELHAWGFDCLAIDLIQGPDYVLAYLCSVNNLHTVPVCLTNRALDHDAIEASGKVKRYYDAQGSHSIKFSAYGAKKAQTEQRDYSEPKWLVDAVDTDALEEVQKVIKALELQKESLGSKLKETGQMDSRLHDQVEVLVKEVEKLAKKRENLLEPMKKWTITNNKNDALLTTLNREKGKSSLDAETKKLKQVMSQQVEKRVRLVLEQSKLYLKKTRLERNKVAICLQLLQAETDLTAMESSSAEKDQELTEARAAYQTAKVKVTELHTATKATLDGMNELVEQADDVTREECTRRRQLADPDLDEVEAELAAQYTALNGTAAISRAVLETYETRKKEIAEWKQKLADGNQALEDAAEKIKEAHALWLPKLNLLINSISEKFSQAFDRMGILGEIGISKDPDYSKWGIQIKVSFREGEALQILTAHRQSGGERALTTVMYLMSLAELSKSPFALVDEINQGMDQRVERFVHNALVKTTCRDNVGQYFLLTPKLLVNLDYHERMKVLCIHNGNWLPENAILISDLVKNKKKANRLAANARAAS